MQNENPYKHSVSPVDGSSMEDIPNRQYRRWMMLVRFLGAGFGGTLLCGLLICLLALFFYWHWTVGIAKGDLRISSQAYGIVLSSTLIVLMFLLPVSFFVSGVRAVTGKFGSGVYVGFLGSLVASAACFFGGEWVRPSSMGIAGSVVLAIFMFFISLVPLICCGALSERYFAKMIRTTFRNDSVG